MARTTPQSEADFDDDAGLSFIERMMQQPPRRIWLAFGLAMTVTVISAAMWYQSSEEGPTPSEQLTEALKLIDHDEEATGRETAREIARHLASIDYRDPRFSGAVEFILGIVAFRDARSLDDVGRIQQYKVAARYLQEAERRSVIPDRRPEWAHALGVSLFYLDAHAQARPLLEEAFSTFERGKTESAMLLADILIGDRTPESNRRAVELNDLVMADTSLSSAEQDRAHLQRARALLALGDTMGAEASLEKISESAGAHQGTVLFRAQILMAAKEYAQAVELLEPVARGEGLEQTFARQAMYLMGVCFEAMQQSDPAINYFQRTAKTFAKSDEGVAASLHAAELLRQKGRNEEALDAYRNALRAVRDPASFRNRWLKLDEFRERIEGAWITWVQGGDFNEAISLSKLMTALLPAVQAYRLTAEANQMWAEHMEQELSELPYRQRQERMEELRFRWRRSGRAFADLADALKAGGNDALWTSAEHFRRGHDFESAYEQLTEFIDARPEELLPAAIVARGKVLMDLDRLDEALEHFELVRTEYPTNIAAFEAQYVIGQCYLERNELEKAENAWQSLLTSTKIDPTAPEWRMALFSLGRLLYHKAAMHKDPAGVQADAEPTDEIRNDSKTELSAWDRAIPRLEEFLKRYPDDVNAVECRYLLAKALQHSADTPRRKLTAAETENARRELRSKMTLLLEQARDEFRKLQGDLAARNDGGQLGNLGQRILRDCSFEIAHTFYKLGLYQEAIVNYSNAANKYPQDPQILLAYLQMANCYDRLGREAEAESMLAQARVILKQLKQAPVDIFQKRSTNMNADEWDRWLDWAERLHQVAHRELDPPAGE